MVTSSPDSPAPRGPHQFLTTRWSLIAEAAQSGSPASAQALADLCESYWYPLYAYVRRRGYDEAQAQDLTQEFFARLLEKNQLDVADPDRGRFRTFLLTSLRNFLSNEWRHAHAEKRGGGRVRLPLDFSQAEDRVHAEPADELTPERLFDRRWALTLLERALGRLAGEYRSAGKQVLFDALQPCLGGEFPAPAYRDLATRLKMTEGAVKVAVHRLRTRCREILRAEIAETVRSPEEIDDELRDLFAALG